MRDITMFAVRKGFVTVFSYEPQHDGDLGFSEGEVVAVMEMLDNGWWKGRIGDDRTGWFPGSYVQVS